MYARTAGFLIFFFSGIINTALTIQAFNLSGISLLLMGKNLATAFLAFEYFPAPAAMTTFGVVAGALIVMASMVWDDRPKGRKYSF